MRTPRADDWPSRRARRRTAHLRRRRRSGRLALTMALLMFGIVAFTVISVAGTAALVGNVSISQLKQYDIGQNSVIYAADGSRLGYIAADRNRTALKWRQISPLLKDATVAIEDRRYWQHGALDFQGILRAAWHDLTTGSLAQGGSTITQQVVRNLYIAKDKSQKTFQRKIDEAILAYELESKESKAKILTDWLNNVFYGNNAYGVEAASETYFSRHAKDVTLPEAALLAGLPQAPSQDDPIQNPAAAKFRRNEVLRAMWSQHYIKRRSVFVSAIEAPLGLRLGHRYKAVRQPQFVSFVEQQLINAPGFGSNLVHRGGLTVHTTFDQRLQRAALFAIRGVLKTPGDPAAALVAIDPRTGEIRALQSSNTQTKFNYASQARRQPGSAFKTMALTLAISRGINPLTTYYESSAFTCFPPTCNPAWSPHNAEPGYGGSINLEEATVGSVNVVFAQLGLDLGPANVAAMAHRLGVSSPLPAVPAITLGADEVTPLELTSAYATLAAGGVYHPPTAVTEVRNPDGKRTGHFTSSGDRRVSDGVAYEVTKILEQNIIRGTGVAARLADGRPEAGKTGTAENFENAWFCGYTPDLATCVWVGYPNRNAPMYSVEGFSPVFGGTIPAEIWKSFMTSALQGVPPHDWPSPKQPVPWRTVSLHYGHSG